MSERIKMFKEIFKNKDLLVFVTAMTIAACDLLSSGFFAIQEVIAAPSHADTPAVISERLRLEQKPFALRSLVLSEEAATERWAERMARNGVR